MLGNLLTFAGLVNIAPAANAGSSGINGQNSTNAGAGSALGIAGAAGTTGKGTDTSLFSNLVNSNNTEGLAQNLIDQVLVPDAEITDQTLAGLLVDEDKKDASSILDTNNAQSLIANATAVQIDNILSNSPSISAIDNKNTFTKIVTEDAIDILGAQNQSLVSAQAQDISKLAAPAMQSLDELAKVTANQNLAADAQADLTTVETPEKISSHLVNKNFAAKQDDRIYGQDNLENMAYYTKQDYLDKAGDLSSTKNPFGIPQNSSVFAEGQDKASFSPDASIENKNFLYGNLDNIFGKHAYNIAKYSINQKGSDFKDAIAESAYKVAHIAKNGNVIDVSLDPANLGKVQIKFDFAHDGKANVMVFAEKQETLDMLQKDSRAMEKILQDSGIKADSGSLSFNLQDGSGSNGASGEQAKNDWNNSGNPFAFSLDQDMSNITSSMDTNNYTSAANSASLYNGNLAQGMLSILV